MQELEDEIRSLPRLAKIAFAVRCAERTLPLLSTADGLDSQPERLLAALKVASDVAAGRRASTDDVALDARAAAQEVIDRTNPTGSSVDMATPQFGFAAGAVSSAVLAAVSSEEVYEKAIGSFWGPFEYAVAHEPLEAYSACNQCYLSGERARTIESTLRSDLRELRARVGELRTPDGPAIDPKSLGDLWPDGQTT